MSLLIWLKSLQVFFFFLTGHYLFYLPKDNANLIGLVLGLEFPIAKPKCLSVGVLPKVFESIKL